MLHCWYLLPLPRRLSALASLLGSRGGIAGSWGSTGAPQGRPWLACGDQGGFIIEEDFAQSWVEKRGSWAYLGVIPVWQLLQRRYRSSQGNSPSLLCLACFSCCRKLPFPWD